MDPLYAVRNVRVERLERYLNVDHVEANLDAAVQRQHHMETKGRVVQVLTNVVSGHVLAAETTHRPS